MRMPTGSVLLRLFLILALVFNGAGSAAALVHATGQQMAAMDGQPMAAAADASCHEAMASMHGAGSEPGAAVPQAPDKDKATDGADCCKSGACHCGCAQGPCAALPLRSQAPVVGLLAPGIGALAVGHPNPAAPHLIRPPIG